jgi:hypothetical protein
MSNKDKTQHHQPAPDGPRASGATTVTPKPAKRRGFFRTIISHLMVALIAVIGVGGYMHWDEILKFTGSRVCAYNVLGQYGGQTPKRPTPDLKKSPPAEKQSSKTQQQSQPAAPKSQADSRSSGAPTPPKAEGETADEKAAEQTPENKTEEKQSARRSLSGSSAGDFQQRWQKARKLFWSDEKAALKAYQKLVQENPDQAELIGELGNVYFKTGDLDKAAETFFRSGEQFIKVKKIDKASEMVEVLRKLETDKATELAERLSTMVQ